MSFLLCLLHQPAFNIAKLYLFACANNDNAKPMAGIRLQIKKYIFAGSNKLTRPHTAGQRWVGSGVLESNALKKLVTIYTYIHGERYRPVCYLQVSGRRYFRAGSAAYVYGVENLCFPAFACCHWLATCTISQVPARPL